MTLWFALSIVEACKPVEQSGSGAGCRDWAFIREPMAIHAGRFRSGCVVRAVVLDRTKSMVKEPKLYLSDTGLLWIFSKFAPQRLFVNHGRQEQSGDIFLPNFGTANARRAHRQPLPLRDPTGRSEEDDFVMDVGRTP